jgi:hypothetical protein
MRPQQERVSFGARWRAARPGCGCGRAGCDGCALTPRTVFVLQAELAWLVDLAEDDIPSVEAGDRLVGDTVFAHLPVAAVQWADAHPMWLERFRRSIDDYVGRLNAPGPVDPGTLAEEIALRMAFEAARAERDPDGVLPPDVADALPALPGDYSWTRAEAEVPPSTAVRQLYGADGERLARPGSALHPEGWFDRA